MASTKISDMTAATDVVGAVVPIVQGGVNKKADASLFAGSGSYWALTGTSTITGATTIDGNANSILIDGNGGGITIDDSNGGGVNINDSGAGGLNITSAGGGITIEETSGGGVTVRDIATGGYVSIQGYDQGVQIETLAGNSNIQLTPHGTGSVIVTKLNLTNETASRVAIVDASKNVVSADTATYPSLTELSYVKGVGNPIQSQINSLGAGTRLYLFNAY